ncbi:MAG: dihydrolipoyl dehydrogenase family protein [bacterium]
MAQYDYDIGIVGGGAAGLTIASGAAQLGAKTLLIEKEENLGGDCLHYGCVPSKTLIRTAYVYHTMKNAKLFGLPQVDLPPVDFHEVSKRIRSVIKIIQKHDSPERFCALGVRVLFGDAQFKDEHTLALNGKAYCAKQWTIATGSSPFIPPIKGLHDTVFLTNKEIFYLERLPKSMNIIGGGPIGIELAQAFHRLGCKVSVIDLADQILNQEDKDMADQVMNILNAEGIDFYLGASVLEVNRKGEEKEILIQPKEGKARTLQSEEILVAVGRSPNIHGLGLEHIGLLFDRKGIKVDSRLRTNHPHIYAAGDINGAFPFTHVAGYEGGIVLSNAIFHLPRKVNYRYVPWCTYTDPELAHIGMNEKTAQAAGIQYSLWQEEFKNNDRSIAEGETKGLVKMLLDEKEKPVGIQILGPHAGELMSEWVACMNGKVSLPTLAAAIHPYPTLGEINKRIAGNFLSTKIFSDKIKKGLKFFFNLKGRACDLAQFSHLEDQ